MKYGSPLVFFTFLLSFSFTGFSQKAEYLDGELYVKYIDNYNVDFSKEFVEPQSLPGFTAEVVNAFGITQARFSFNKTSSIKLQRTVRIKFTAIDKAGELIEYLSKLHFIEYAERIPVVYPDYIPNDLGTNALHQLWHLYKIKAREAWDSTKGDSNIKVAVVDQEFDINHPDLKSNVWKNPNEIENNNIDDDSNGYIDDVFGWDFADDDNNVICNTNIFLNHGTPCAGLVAAVSDNGIGVASIGFNISFIPVKVCNDNQANTNLTYPYEGIAYAANMNADIISCSFGGPVYSTTRQNVIDYAVSKGCLVVAGAGNENNSSLFYPAAYNNVISVAATDITDFKASFSTYGSWVDISAPGVNNRTTTQNNGYISFSGTSGACPITAGLLGLMKSFYPNITNQQLEYCLVNYADNIDALNPSYAGQLGGGRINAEKAMKCVDSIKKTPPKLIISVSERLVCPNKVVIFNAVAANKNLDSIKWYFPGGDSLFSTSFNPSVKYIYDGLYGVSAVGYNRYGKDSVFIADFIEVSPSLEYLIFFDDFEDNNSFTKYGKENTDNEITWQLTTAAKTALPNNKALKMDFYNYNSPGQRDAFITPAIDLSLVKRPRLFFQHAYKAGSLVATDSINVYASADSGKTFPYKIVSMGRTGMQTSSLFSAEFTPSSNDHWCFGSSSNCKNEALDSLAEKKNVMLKFESYRDIGNNLYIDNIKVYAQCGDVIYAKPICNFTASDTIICANNSITFTDKSIFSPKSYKWIFNGGIPAISTDANPIVKYAATGSYDVTLITINPIGSDTLTLKNYIRIKENPQVVLADTQKYVCMGDSVFFTASGTDSIRWQTPKGFAYGDSLADKPVKTTVYVVKAFAPNGCTDSALAKAVYVPLPPIGSLYQYPDSLTLEAQHTAGNFGYKWYYNDTLLPAFTTKIIKPLKSGNYKIELTDSAGCTSISPAFYFAKKTKGNVGITGVINSKINIYPNPANDRLFVEGLDEEDANVTITDITGRHILQQELVNQYTVDISAISPGIYIVIVAQGDSAAIRKIIIE